ncbi:MAG: PD40 domain-containing protein [Candidatus Aminicenantes bacterium]|nr:PD40 domain-containing protein [Candidatus Aminicenantes bacterium]
MKTKKIITIISITLIVLFAAPLFSQQFYMPYYGKNKVMRQKFKWRTVETPNFKIHYYVNNPRLVKKIAAQAEKAYDKVSKLLNYRVERKTPLIFYKSHIDFEQTNIIPSFIPPGAIGFSDRLARRVVIQGDMPSGEMSRLIAHEMAHVFENTILGRASLFRPPPLWVTEGLAEYVAGHWRSIDLLVERDNVLNDWIPTITKGGQLRSQYMHGRSAYNWGHFIYDFLESKFGPRGVRQLLYSYRTGMFGAGKRNFFKTFNYTPKMFNHEFRKFMRDKFKRFRSKENPEDYSYNIGPDFPYVYSFSHQLSPSGEVLAVLTGNRKSGKVEIILISMKTGKTIINITPGYTRKYDGIQFQFNPENGISISWDKNAEKIAFFARKSLDNYLVMVDVLSGKILKRIKLKNIEAPTSPDFHPNGKELYFIGIDNSRSFIFTMDLKSEKVRKVTTGALYIKAFNISPDGKKIAFSAKGDKYQKLYLGPIEKPELAKKLTDGNYSDIAPTFSPDGKKVYYSSDEMESYNLNAIELDTQTMYRYTDVRTGNFFPIEIPGEKKADQKKELVFSTYYKGMFHLFKKDISEYIEKRRLEFVLVANNEADLKKRAASFEEDFEIGTGKKETTLLAQGKMDMAAAAQLEQKSLPDPTFKVQDKGRYKPLKSLFLRGYTPVAGAIGTDGSIMGYTAMNFSDIMGDHNFQFMASSYFGYRSYHLTYVNQASRLQYFGALYYYTDSFYISYNAYIKIRQKLGGTLGFYYPFSRSLRAEASASFYVQEENIDEIFYGDELPYAQFFDGPVTRLNISLAGDTILFSRFGPLMGHTFRFSFDKYVKLGDSFMDGYSVETDFRKYFKLGRSTLLALRTVGYFSKGAHPQLYWLGGDNTLRASEFRRLVGSNVAFFNAEFRFPIVYQANTFIGVLGPIRGVFFFDIGGVWMNGQDFQVFDEGRGLNRLFKEGGIKLRDPIASYGFGLAFYMFGYPLHIDWVHKTDLHARKYYGVNFWIGFDF